MLLNERPKPQRIWPVPAISPYRGISQTCLANLKSKLRPASRSTSQDEWYLYKS